MNIILAGFTSDITESELRQMLSRYVELDELDIIPGDLPEQTVAVLTVEGSSVEAHRAARRLTGLYWHGQSLRAYISLF
jgi:hypothetical protein